jgi:hypothetical protein
MLQTAYSLIRGTAFAIALCVTPALFGQSPTTLQTHSGVAEIRWNHSKRVLAGTAVTEGPVAAGTVYVIDNISLQVGGSGAQTYLVEFIVNQYTTSPRVYYFLLSPTTTFAGGVPIGVLNQPTKIRLDPGDTLAVSFNGYTTVPPTVDGVISGFLAPYNTSLPL